MSFYSCSRHHGIVKYLVKFFYSILYHFFLNFKLAGLELYREQLARQVSVISCILFVIVDGANKIY